MGVKVLKGGGKGLSGLLLSEWEPKKKKYVCTIRKFPLFHQEKTGHTANEKEKKRVCLFNVTQISTDTFFSLYYF